ncbi:MAG: 5'/3'-nucleotidase SurE [bacterium]|nr:5'/3'-nucleotidase SurE [bacterium]
MNILLTNDDGIKAEGLHALRKGLSKLGKVIIIAPDRERSASGHSLTLTHPIRVEQIDEDTFVTDGTPADCINIGIFGILPTRPDLIVSGINPGPNLGEDITYSGTVSAAMEGTLLKIPSFAISMGSYTNPQFDFAAEFASKIADLILNHGLPPYTFLNVNVPNGPEEKIKGVSITHLGNRKYQEELIKRLDPRGKVYYWIGSKVVVDEPGKEGTDVRAIQEDKISITPIHLDMTNYPAIPEIKLSIEGKL